MHNDHDIDAHAKANTMFLNVTNIMVMPVEGMGENL